MRQMTRQEAMEFLSDGTRTGKIATVREDGSPHVVPIWFIIDDGDIVFTTWHESVKLRNLATNSRAALVADLEEPPYAYVSVEGRISLSDDLDELKDYAHHRPAGGCVSNGGPIVSYGIFPVGASGVVRSACRFSSW
jgi:PPOX class probable F420-dependent enzyme